jgi:hypothetical protein
MVNRVCCYLLLCLLSAILTSTCSARSFIGDKTVRMQVLKVSSSRSDFERAAAAEDLFDMVKGKDLSHVSWQTIHMISDFMGNNPDGVTIWIAATLGEFGGRASFAAPRLVETLNEVDCRRVDASSAFTIRVALKKMGENVPVSECSK